MKRKVSQTFATSLLELIQEEGSALHLSRQELHKVLQESITALEAIAFSIKQVPLLRALTESSSFGSRDTKEGELDEVLDIILLRHLPDTFPSSIRNLLLNTLLLLNERGKDELESVVQFLHEGKNTLFNEVPIQIETSYQLSPEEQEELLQKVVSRVLPLTHIHTDAKLQVKWMNNPDLIGGLIVRVNDMVFDASIKRALRELEQDLLL
jgi:F0F1-type ATP synthase delta subunit